MKKNIIFGDYINSLSIYDGLKKLGYTSFFYNSNRWGIKTKKNYNGDSVLFFTEENTLRNHLLNNSSCTFSPKKFPDYLLDDKYEFAKFLESINETPIPTLNEKHIEFPFYLKFKRSWENGVKMPRGFIIKNKEDLNTVEATKLKKYESSQYFYQKLLDLNIKNTISVCGYFDSVDNSRNMLFACIKILGDNNTMATSDGVETVPLPISLHDSTYNILNNLNFVGPFELEFIYDESSEKYYVNELNPRFWMQHGIAIKFFDNNLLKRYLNIEDNVYDNGVVPYRKITWLNSINLIRNKHFLKYKNFKKIFRKNIILYPNIFYMFKYLKSNFKEK